jgi:hypothetical protein
MKKLLAIMMTITMVFSAACGKTNKNESRKEETVRIMTSYIGVEDTKEGTEFEFDTYNSAEDFEYYWLDYGQTVSGVIWRTDTDNYYVTIVGEKGFDDVCRRVLKDYGGYEAAWN